jgi:hypothetical protein
MLRVRVTRECEYVIEGGGGPAGWGRVAGPHILSRMAPTSHELALQYLLELSSDIHLAFLWDRDGDLLASAPAGAPDLLNGLAAELVGEAETSFIRADAPDLEVDAGCDEGAVFLIRNAEMTMLCVTERTVLPGLIFYDMHAVLRDLKRAAEAESRRQGVIAQ